MGRRIELLELQTAYHYFVTVYFKGEDENLRDSRFISQVKRRWCSLVNLYDREILKRGTGSWAAAEKDIRLATPNQMMTPRLNHIFIVSPLLAVQFSQQRPQNDKAAAQHDKDQAIAQVLVIPLGFRFTQHCYLGVLRIITDHDVFPWRIKFLNTVSNLLARLAVKIGPIQNLLSDVG